MEEMFHQHTREIPPLKYQGSANMMGKVDKTIRKGRLETLTIKELVPYIGDHQ